MDCERKAAEEAAGGRVYRERRRIGGGVVRDRGWRGGKVRARRSGMLGSRRSGKLDEPERVSEKESANVFRKRRVGGGERGGGGGRG